MARRTVNLSAPTQVAFVISLIIAALGVLAALNVVGSIGVASVWIMTGAYVVLALACLFRGT